MKDYHLDSGIQRLLNGGNFPGEEDRLILQPDGTLACVGWELTSGFHLDNLTQEKELSDEELLRDAYREAGLNPR